jgi:hypothetical protein
MVKHSFLFTINSKLFLIRSVTQGIKKTIKNISTQVSLNISLINVVKVIKKNNYI